MRKLLTAGAVVGGVVVAISMIAPAQADTPGFPPAFATITNVGSDTTEFVTQGQSEFINAGYGGLGATTLASFNATGSATINTNANAACTALPRPNGSGAGQTALQTSLNAANGCVTSARASAPRIVNGTTVAGTTAATYLAEADYAVDGLSVAVLPAFGGPGLAGLDLSLVQAIYSNPATGTVVNDASVHNSAICAFSAMIPQAGSGTRQFFIGTVLNPVRAGAPGSANLSTAATTAQLRTLGFPCITDVDRNGAPVQEHDGRVIIDDNDITPMSTAQYFTQTTGAVADRRGASTLAKFGSTLPFELNVAFPVQRTVTNLFPRSQIGADYATSNSLTAQLYVGPNSAFCKNRTTTKAFGFGVSPTCGTVRVAAGAAAFANTGASPYANTFPLQP